MFNMLFASFFPSFPAFAEFTFSHLKNRNRLTIEIDSRYQFDQPNGFDSDISFLNNWNVIYKVLFTWRSARRYVRNDENNRLLLSELKNENVD